MASQTPFEQLGGGTPQRFHTPSTPSMPNKVTLLIHIRTAQFNPIPLFHSLQMPYVNQCILEVSPHVPLESIQPLHPLIRFQHAPVVPSTLVPNSGGWVYQLDDPLCIHPFFWDFLQSAKEGTTYDFKDDKGGTHTIEWVHPNSPTTPRHVSSNRVAAYASITEEEKEDILDTIQHATIARNKARISELTIDTTAAFTPLCFHAMKFGTDKSPYNLVTHRHPYTAVYDLLLAPYFQRSQYDNGRPLKIGELGILHGASVRMWREVFPFAQLHAFDAVENYLKALSDIPGLSTHLVDVGKPHALRKSIQEACTDGRGFDIFIEDASHTLSHQLLFIREAIHFIAPGGVMIIEDIFRDIPTARFQEAVDDIGGQVERAVMVDPEHKYRWSPGWNNDRLLFIWKR